MKWRKDKGMRRSAATWYALALVLVALPLLQGCAKSRLARPAPAATTTVAATGAAAASSVGGTLASPSVSRPQVEVDPIAMEEADDDSVVFSAIDSTRRGSGQAGIHHAEPGLSGDRLPGSVSLAGIAGTSAETALGAIAERADLKVFFSTNSIDRGVVAKRVDLGGGGAQDTAAAVDRVCRSAGLSCFYAADYRSLSVYDPREFQASGPDMTALVYDRREGFEVASAATATRVTTNKPVADKPKPAATRKPVAGKPKPASARKPASGKPKPAAAKPGKPKPAAAKPKPASAKPPAVKPKPASAKPAPSKKPPAPARKPARS